MRHWKRLVYYLMINVLVSACTMLAVLSIWDRTHPPVSPSEEPVAQAASSLVSQTPVVAGAGSGGQVENPQENPQPEEASTTREEEEEAEPTLPVVYEVQAGDTLGGIADQFGLSLDDLLAANEDLIDPNRLEVGQILNLPVSEEPEPTDTPAPPEETEPAEETDTPSPPTNTPPVVTGEAQVIIERIVGAGDLESERVLLKRAGTGEISLAGWKILEEGGEVFTFPQLILFEGGAVNLYTRAGQQTVVDLFWGLDAPVWSSGETVVLMDQQGEVRATYQVP